MKTFIFSIIAILSLGVFTFGNTNAEMTVKDYFLAIPNEFIKAPAAKRTAWIEQDSSDIGYLAYTIPVKELTGEEGEGSVWGALQIFEKTGGGVMIGMVNNLCADGECMGLMRFLDYKAGKFTDVSEDYLIIPDNDEVIKILREAPAFENKDSLKDGEQVPLALQFNGNQKSVQFIAGCKKDCDGGVVAKQFKWNGEAFIEFEDEVSPE
jgi:hypothetical protein